MLCDPRLPESSASEALSPQLFARISGWAASAAAFRVQRIIGDAFKPGARVLDIGTGPGVIPMHLQRSYPATFFYGCDICSDMLALARLRSIKKRSTIRLFGGDAQRLPCADSSIDVALCLFALHHFDAPECFLQEVDRVLKPEGTLLILDFRRDLPPRFFRLLNCVWQVFFFFSTGRIGFRDFVRSPWCPEEIRDIINKNGLKRLQVQASRMELLVTNKSIRDNIL